MYIFLESEINAGNNQSITCMSRHNRVVIIRKKDRRFNKFKLCMDQAYLFQVILLKNLR